LKLLEKKKGSWAVIEGNEGETHLPRKSEYVEKEKALLCLGGSLSKTVTSEGNYVPWKYQFAGGGVSVH